MKKHWLLVLSLVLTGLVLAQAQQTQQTQQQQVQQQPVRMQQDYTTLNPDIDYSMVRVAHLSPNAPSVNILFLRDDADGTVQQQTVPAQPATTQQPATTEQVQQPVATEQQVGMGMLEIVVEPGDALVNLTGPEGYEDMFTGSQTLSNLMPGVYIVSATRQGFEPASAEVEVAQDDVATVELTLDETAGDEAAQLRQQEQQLTPEQQERLQAREQQMAQPQQVQQPAQQQDWQPMQQPGMMAGMDAFQNLSYEEVTDYLAVPSGDYRVQIVTADASQLAYEGTVSLGGGAYYTIAAVGFVLEDQGGVQPVVEEEGGGGFLDWLSGLFGADDGPDPDDLSIRLRVFDDEPGNFPRAGEAHIRVIHASAGSPEIDLVWSRGPVTHTAQQQAAAEPVQQPAATPQQQQTQAATTQQQQVQAVQQQEGMGNLDILVEPADALVSIVGPDGYEDFFSGSQTLVNLPPGSYVVSATRQGYEASVQEASVSENDTASVQLTLEESEGEEAAQLRQQEQPLTAEQQQQIEARQQQVQQQPGAVPTDPATQQPGTVQDPAAAPAADPAAAPDPVMTDPAMVEPAGEENVVAGGVAYGRASGYSAVRVMGNFGLQIRQAGDDTRTVLLDLSSADIRPGHVYTIFVSGTTFEDYAFGYLKVTDSSLGGGTDDINTQQGMQGMQEQAGQEPAAQPATEAQEETQEVQDADDMNGDMDETEEQEEGEAGN